MRIVTAVLFLLVSRFCSAQQVVDVSKQDVHMSPNLFYVSGGEPFVNAKFVNLVEGTPYFTDEWLKGIAFDAASQEYKDIKFKIDLIDNTLHYLDDKEKEYVATVPLRELILTDSSGNNYRFIHSIALESYRKKVFPWCVVL